MSGRLSGRVAGVNHSSRAARTAALAATTAAGHKVSGHSVLKPNDGAHQLFDEMCVANTFQGIMSTFQQLCDILELKPSDHRGFYTQLKTRLTSWKAKSLWAKLDKRAAQKEYRKGTCCANTRVLIIGAGPCGLRTAIELALLGAKTVVVEKRDRFSRNAVLHLWPFLITDLKMLGAKKFFGKFCAGSIDHISIRTLQCILLKAALLLGVEVHPCVSFEGLREPPEDQENERVGWRANIFPSDSPVVQYEFDVLIGADGKRNTLPGFKRKEFRGKLAIAITANFINNHTQAEASVEEISGVAFIFNQKFFKDLYEKTGVDLENIVYYKDETHYFVMTAKKASLLEKGVLYQDYADTAALLAKDNVCQEALLEYARQAADVSTENQLPALNYAHNHYGQDDVAMFDFTSLFAAEQASTVYDRNGHKLLIALVGDSLLEPFWPTGSGCARGFLGALDAAWMVRSWASGTKTPLEVMAERESIYQLLSQTAPEAMPKNYSSYTIDPCTRYTTLNTQHFNPVQMRSQYDAGDQKYQDHIVHITEKSKRYDYIRDSHYLFKWLQKQLEGYSSKIVLNDLTTSWRSGMALCALIHKYRPELIDFDNLNEEHVEANNQLAFDIAEKEFGVAPVMSVSDLQTCEVPDQLTMVSYLSQFYDFFRKESSAPPAKIAKSSDKSFRAPRTQSPSSRLSLLSKLNQRARQRRLRAAKLKASVIWSSTEDIYSHYRIEEKQPGPADDSDTDSVCSDEIKMHTAAGRKRVRQPTEQSGIFQGYLKFENDERKPKTRLEQVKETMRAQPDPGIRGQNKVSALAKNLAAEWGIPVQEQDETAETGDKIIVVAEKALPTPKPLIQGMAARADRCYFCNERVYLVERYSAEGVFFHRGCLRCDYCNTNLRIGQYSFQRCNDGQAKFYCFQHVGLQKPVYKSRKRNFGPNDPPLPSFTDIPSNDTVDHMPVAVRPRPVASLPSSCGKKQTPERIEYVTESEMEESEFETAQHNRTASLYGSSTSEDDSSSEDDVSTDDEISLAELARAYRKQLNRSTQRHTRSTRRKPVCRRYDSDGDSTGSGSDGAISTGSDTAHESDADWDLEDSDSETEKESEGEDSSDTEDNKMFNLSRSPPSFPAAHFYSNRYRDRHAQLTRPTSLQTYDAKDIKTHKTFQERLYGGDEIGPPPVASVAPTANLKPKPVEEKHVSPTSQQVVRNRFNFFSAAPEPVQINAKNFLGLQTPVHEKKVAVIDEETEVNEDEELSLETEETAGSTVSEDVVDRGASDDETTIHDDITGDMSSSDLSSEISNLDDDTYTGSSSDDRPPILPHEVPDIQIQEASSNQQSLESLSFMKGFSDSDDVSDSCSDTESSYSTDSEHDSAEIISSETNSDTVLANQSVVSVIEKTGDLQQDVDTSVIGVTENSTEDSYVLENSSIEIPTLNSSTEENSIVDNSKQDNSTTDFPIVNDKEDSHSADFGITIENISVTSPELRMDRDLDKDIDTLETDTDKSTDDAQDVIKLSDSDEQTVTVTSYSQDTVKSRCADKDSSASDLANETDADVMSMDWDHRDLDNLNLEGDETSSTTGSSSKGSPTEGFIAVPGVTISESSTDVPVTSAGQATTNISPLSQKRSIPLVKQGATPLAEEETDSSEFDSDEEQEAQVYNIPTVCVEDTSILDDPVDGKVEQQLADCDKNHKLPENDVKADQSEEIVEKEGELLSHQMVEENVAGDGDVDNVIIDPLLPIDNESDNKLEDNFVEENIETVETCVDTGLPVSKVLKEDGDIDTSVSEETVLSEKNSVQKMNEEIVAATQKEDSVCLKEISCLSDNQNVFEDVSIPNSNSEDAVVELSSRQLGIEGLDAVSMHNADSLSLDSRDLAMVVGNAPLAVFTPSSDEMDFDENLESTICEDVLAKNVNLDVDAAVVNVSAESLYDNVIMPINEDVLTPVEGGRNDNLPLSSTPAKPCDTNKNNVIEPRPNFAPVDPWEKFNIKSGKKLEDSIKDSEESPTNGREEKPPENRTLSKVTDSAVQSDKSTSPKVAPRQEDGMSDSPQQEACRRIDQLLDSVKCITPAAASMASTLPRDQQPPPLPPLKELLGSSLPSNSLDRSISSETAQSEDTVVDADVSVNEKFVTVRRPKKLRKQRCTSLSSDSDFSDLDDVEAPNGVSQMPERDKSLSFDMLLDGLNSLGKEINESIEILAERSNIDDSLSIDGLLQDNYNDDVVLDNVSLKNIANSEDMSLKSSKNNLTLIEDIADSTLNDSSVYYTPDISINEPSPAKTTSKKPTPLNVKCANIEKKEATLDALGNESPLYSPSRTLADSKRRFFFEVTQPVRIDPFNPQIGLCQNKDKENNHVTDVTTNANRKLDNDSKKKAEGMKDWHSVDSASSPSGTKRKMEQQKGKPKLQLKKDWKSVDGGVVSPTAGVPHTDAVNGDSDTFYSPTGDTDKESKPIRRQLPAVPDTPPLTPDEIKQIKHAELADAKQAAKQRAKAKTDEQLGITQSPSATKSTKVSAKKERIKSAPTDRRKGESSKKTSLASFPSPTFSKKREKSKSLDRTKSNAHKKESVQGDKENAGEKKQRRSLLSMFMPSKKEQSSKRNSGTGMQSGSTGTGGSERSSSKTPSNDRKFMRHKPRAKTANLRAIEKEMEKRVSMYDEFNPMFEDIYGAEANPLSDQQKQRLKQDIVQKLEVLAPTQEKENEKIAPRATADEFDTESEMGDGVSMRSFKMQPQSEEDVSRMLRKQQRALQRRQREQQLKRLRSAQQIQRDLEVLENKQKELEAQGVVIEQQLRQNPDNSIQEATSNGNELMQDWFKVVHEKSQLVRRESELMVQARELELEDRQSRLEQRLRELLAAERDSSDGDTGLEEQKIMDELLEVIEQRDALVALLEEDRQRELQLNEDITAAHGMLVH